MRQLCEKDGTWEEQISPLRDASHPLRLRSGLKAILGRNDGVVTGLTKYGTNTTSDE